MFHNIAKSEEVFIYKACYIVLSVPFIGCNYLTVYSLTMYICTRRVSFITVIHRNSNKCKCLTIITGSEVYARRIGPIIAVNKNSNTGKCLTIQDLKVYIFRAC